MSGFLNNVSLIFNFMLSCVSSIWELMTTYYILMLPFAILIVYKISKLFKLF